MDESWSVLQPGQPVNFSDDRGMFDCTFVDTFIIFLSSYSWDKFESFFKEYKKVSVVEHKRQNSHLSPPSPQSENLQCGDPDFK